MYTFRATVYIKIISQSSIITMFSCLLHTTNTYFDQLSRPFSGSGKLVNCYRVFGRLSEIIGSTTGVWIQNVNFTIFNSFRF